MENEKLRDRLVIEITKILLERGMESLAQPTFSYFLRANPLLLANAIVTGKLITGEELQEICAPLPY